MLSNLIQHFHFQKVLLVNARCSACGGTRTCGCDFVVYDFVLEVMPLILCDIVSSEWLDVLGDGVLWIVVADNPIPAQHRIWNAHV